MSTRWSTAFDKDVEQALRRVADRDECSVSSIIKRAVRRYLEGEKTISVKEVSDERAGSFSN